jgi:hypothetical protein
MTITSTEEERKLAGYKKVIDGFRHCEKDIGCYGCPYSTSNKPTPECKSQLFKDAFDVVVELDAIIQRDEGNENDD